MDESQLNLFPPLDFVDYSYGSTSKSTRTKDPKRKTIALLHGNDRLSTPSATDLNDRIAAANQLRKSNYANL